MASRRGKRNAEANGNGPYLRLDGRCWDCLRAVEQWRQRAGEGPTLADLAVLVGVSTGTARRLVEELAEWPMVELERHDSGRLVSGSLDLSKFGRWVLQHAVEFDDEARVWAAPTPDSLKEKGRHGQP